MATFDKEAARQAGYTDEEIQAFLQSNPKLTVETGPSAPVDQGEPPPPNTNITPIDKTAETTGIVAGGVAQALPYALGAYGTYKAGQVAKDVVGRVFGGASPSAGAVAPRIEPSLGNPQPARAPIPTGSNVIQFPGPANAPAQAVQAAENPSLMSRAAQMYRTYAPVVGEKLATAGRAVAPAVEAGARVASRIAGPASAMLYSGGLNEGEDQAMARIRAIQDSVQRLPREQQTMYLNMPMDKRQRVDQMILMGANPAALLVPNAINSGFAQELNKLGR
jgi:hypothetical protein